METSGGSADACRTCKIRQFALCDGLLVSSSEGRNVSPSRTEIGVRGRRNIYESGQQLGVIPVIAHGWAFSFRLLPDGRRQILSILLPGDLISVISVFRDRLAVSVQAMTDVKYCTFRRSELPGFGEASQLAQELWRDACNAEFDDYTSRIVDLGRRSANERVARLLLGLWTRMKRIGEVQDDRFFFPLRQQHIADTLGLTPVHVSRVLNSFRRDGLIELTRAELYLTDIPGLRQLADMDS